MADKTAAIKRILKEKREQYAADAKRKEAEKKKGAGPSSRASGKRSSAATASTLKKDAKRPRAEEASGVAAEPEAAPGSMVPFVDLSADVPPLTEPGVPEAEPTRPPRPDKGKGIAGQSQGPELPRRRRRRLLSTGSETDEEAFEDQLSGERSDAEEEGL